MASIQFTDATGAATLNSSWPSGASRRLRGWAPFPRHVGQAANKLSDGQLHRFRFRTDYTASFEMPGISAADQEMAQRFIEYITDDGATCTLNTDDLASRSYTCCLTKDTEPELVPENQGGCIEFTLRLTLTNIVTSPTKMLCVYQ